MEGNTYNGPDFYSEEYTEHCAEVVEAKDAAATLSKLAELLREGWRVGEYNETLGYGVISSYGVVFRGKTLPAAIDAAYARSLSNPMENCKYCEAPIDPRRNFLGRCKEPVGADRPIACYERQIEQIVNRLSLLDHQIQSRSNGKQSAVQKFAKWIRGELGNILRLDKELKEK